MNNLNPLADVTKNNKSIATPVVSTISVDFDRVTITGSNLDKVTEMTASGWGNNHTLTITSQSASSVVGLVTSPSLTFYAQQTYDLIISSASGQTVYPINFQMLDNTVSSAKLQNSSVTSDKIATKAVTYSKIDTTGADDGDVLTYSQADGAWLAAPPVAGGGGGGSVSSIARGTGLVNQGSSITTTGTIAVNVGSGSGQIQTLDASGDFSFGNSIILNSQTVGEGIFSLLDSGASSDFQFYNTGDFHLTYSSNLTTYNDALKVKSSDGDVEVVNDLVVGSTLKINNGGSNTSIMFPSSRGNVGEFLRTDGAGGTSWALVAGTGTVTTVTRGVGFASQGTSITTTGTLDLDVGTTGSKIPQLSGGFLAEVIIPQGIDATKIGANTNVSDAEYGYLDGVTSAIQTQLGAREPTITAGVNTQYYRGDKTWQTLDTNAVPDVAGKRYMSILDYAAIGLLPLSGVANQTQPVSERTVALLKESVTSLLEPLITLNNGVQPTSGQIIVGNAGGVFTYNDFLTYLNTRIHPSGTQSNLLLGMGVGTATITAGALGNIGIGSGAMAAITSGDNNSAVGYTALAALTTGGNNTAFGYRALLAGTTAAGNTALGLDALNDVTIGTYNTAVGAYIMDNGTGTAITQNTGVGYSIMRAVTSNSNTAVGYNTLNALGAGAFNVAMGALTGDSLTTGSNNVLLGYNAGTELTTSSNNTIMGYGAGSQLTTTGSNVIIGADAGPTAAPTNGSLLFIDNAISDTPLIGGNFTTNVVYINHDPDQLVDLPNATSGLWVDGSAYKSDGSSSWSLTSDARLKERIVDYDRGLEEILELRPVRFHYKENATLGLKGQDEHIGILAQEVQTVIPESITTGARGYLNFHLDPVVWTSVRAIQELHKKIEKLEIENKQLKSYLCTKDPKAPFCTP